eukprot:m.309865 g.309865  ORF g.309865 m.309865 type:complete len:266 (-) comp20204_c0_seq7:1087-1884(-)
MEKDFDSIRRPNIGVSADFGYQTVRNNTISVLMKVITQMAKDLYGDPINRPGMAKVGTHAEVPTIYIPQQNDDLVGRQCPNDIEEVCTLLEKTIKTTVQNTLNSLKRDSDDIAKRLTDKIEDDRLAVSKNMSARLWGFLYMVLGVLVPIFIVMIKVVNNADEAKLLKVLPMDAVPWVMQICGLLGMVSELIPHDYLLRSYALVALLSLALILYARSIWSIQPRLTTAQRTQLIQYKQYIEDDVVQRQKQLYKVYLESAVGANHRL